MRLAILDHGHRRRARAFLAMTSLASRAPAADVVKLLLYRPAMLGRPMTELSAAAMRGASAWTAAEREWLALQTARRNACTYCARTHEELVRIAADGRTDVLETPRPVLRAASDVLAAAALDAGVEEAVLAARTASATDEALRVGLVWETINRLADAFGFTLSARQLATGPKALHRFGYRFPAPLLAGGEGPETVTPGQPAATAAVAHLRALHEIPGESPRAARAAAAGGDALGEPLDGYLAAVREHPTTITDDDVAMLRAAGSSEDAICELTVAAAVGEAMRIHDRGLAALEDGPSV